MVTFTVVTVVAFVFCAAYLLFVTRFVTVVCHDFTYRYVDVAYVVYVLILRCICCWWNDFVVDATRWSRYVVALRALLRICRLMLRMMVRLFYLGYSYRTHATVAFVRPARFTGFGWMVATRSDQFPGCSSRWLVYTHTRAVYTLHICPAHRFSFVLWLPLPYTVHLRLDPFTQQFTVSRFAALWLRLPRTLPARLDTHVVVRVG